MSDPKANREERKQRRQLGVTFRGCMAEYRIVKADGDVDMGDKEAVSDAIMTNLVAAKAGDPSIDWGSIDWEKLFEFIMKIVTLFMSFM